MVAQGGQAVISWSGLIWLWCFWRRIAWPGRCPLTTERVLTLSEQTFFRCQLYQMLASPLRCETGGKKQLKSERTSTSLLQQDYRWHIQAHHSMHWAFLQTLWGRQGSSGGFLSGEEQWAGQGEGRGLLAVKSHLLRAWEGVVVTWDIGHYGLLIRP